VERLGANLQHFPIGNADLEKPAPAHGAASVNAADADVNTRAATPLQPVRSCGTGGGSKGGVPPSPAPDVACGHVGYAGL
jgi:hypothetical protein